MATAIPCPTPMHMVQSASLPPALQLIHGGERQAGAAHAERMAQCDGAAAGVDPGVVIGQPQLPGAGERLGRKGLVDFENIEVVQAQAQAFAVISGLPEPARCP